jgi:hypothetical protein
MSGYRNSFYSLEELTLSVFHIKTLLWPVTKFGDSVFGI